jgi:thiol-disulfide isomerase/thioredoxin
MAKNLFLVLALLAGAIAPSCLAQEAMKAPDLQSDEWLNTDRPLKSFVDDLKGQVVLLDFWTYCCINCLHVLPDLAQLEKDFADQPVQVIGVHSNKFPQEGEAKNIRQAILRYHIQHPVVVDQKHKIWQSYAVRSWPTLVLIDPEGKIVGKVSGEGHYETLKAAIQETLDEHRKKGTLAAGPLKLEKEAAPKGPLLYPGKVFPHGEHLYVADSSNHRILQLNRKTGAVNKEFRGANPPLKGPQGMAWHGGSLYIADTENHLLRRLNVETGKMETVAGTGKQARPLPDAGPGLDTPINSPWALETDGDDIYVAMAGSHQLWTFETKTGKLKHLAGSGWENILDGPAATARLAQPSGLALLGRKLYFADSEVSAIRAVDLTEMRTETLVGTHLFDHGDADGVGVSQVKLQHPLGVAIWDGKLLVADTYNSKIKLLDPDTHRATTLLGPDQLPLWEPSGLAVEGDLLYIADTNHHRVIEVNLTDMNWRQLIGLDVVGKVGGTDVGEKASDG